MKPEVGLTGRWTLANVGAAATARLELKRQRGHRHGTTRQPAGEALGQGVRGRNGPLFIVRPDIGLLRHAAQSRQQVPLGVVAAVVSAHQKH